MRERSSNSSGYIFLGVFLLILIIANAPSLTFSQKKGYMPFPVIWRSNTCPYMARSLDQCSSGIIWWGVITSILFWIVVYCIIRYITRWVKQ